MAPDPDESDPLAEASANTRLATNAVRVIAVGMALVHMYTAIFGLLDAILQRTIHLLLSFFLLLLINPKPVYFSARFGAWGQNAYRAFIAACAIVPLIYLLVNFQYLTDGRIQYVGMIFSCRLLADLNQNALNSLF